MFVFFHSGYNHLPYIQRCNVAPISSNDQAPLFWGFRKLQDDRKYLDNVEDGTEEDGNTDRGHTEEV